MKDHSSTRRVLGLVADFQQFDTCHEAIADWSRDTRGEALERAVAMLYSMVKTQADQLGIPVDAWISSTLQVLDEDEAQNR